VSVAAGFAAGLCLAVVLAPLPAASIDGRPVDLQLKNTDGKKVRLSDYRGSVVLLNFWATWCLPCRAEMPILVKAHQEYGSRGVKFIGAALDDRQSRLKIPEFVREMNIAFPVWTGASTMDLDDLKLGQSVPATIFVNRDGRIVSRVLGEITAADLRERLEWLTGDQTGTRPQPLITHLSDPGETAKRSLPKK
jgi:thiol-disulfide isomerase/thioredoxin